MKLKVGDRVEGWGVVRRITAVRPTGYSWVYDPDDWGREFMSENSSDPFFDRGWALRRPMVPKVCGQCGDRWETAEEFVGAETMTDAGRVFHRRRVGPEGSRFEYIWCGPVEAEDERGTPE